MILIIQIYGDELVWNDNSTKKIRAYLLNLKKCFPDRYAKQTSRGWLVTECCVWVNLIRFELFVYDFDIESLYAPNF